MPRNTIDDYHKDTPSHECLSRQAHAKKHAEGSLFDSASNKYEQAERRRIARSRAKTPTKEIIPVPPKPQALASNMKNMIEDLQDIDKLRDARHLLHSLLNDDDYDVSEMEGNDITHYRRSFEKVYGTLPDDIDILEIIAMASVRLDLLTKKIKELLDEFELTFSVKIVDDWER